MLIMKYCNLSVAVTYIKQNIQHRTVITFAMTHIIQNSSNEILISQTLERKHKNPNHECKNHKKYRTTK